MKTSMWWGTKVLFVLCTLFLCANCRPVPSTPALLPQTIVLPTRAPTSKPTPVNTRVMPIESLTPAPTPTITPIPNEVYALVVGIIDGRTISVVMNGDPPNRMYAVRYLGIETPPLEDPWGKAAYEANRKLAGLKVVRLVRDQSDFDQEGYLLRYVYVADTLTSLYLTEQGLARAAITPPDTRFEQEIMAAEARAKQDKLGLWSGGLPTPIVKPEQITPTLTLTPTAVVTVTATVTTTPTGTTSGQ